MPTSARATIEIMIIKAAELPSFSFSVWLSVKSGETDSLSIDAEVEETEISEVSEVLLDTLVLSETAETTLLCTEPL